MYTIAFKFEMGQTVRIRSNGLNATVIAFNLSRGNVKQIEVQYVDDNKHVYEDWFHETDLATLTKEPTRPESKDSYDE